MQSLPRKFKQIVVMVIIIFSVIAFSCCFGDDDNNDNDNKNGNGNNEPVNGNNTTNGDNNTPVPEEVIEFVSIDHEPQKVSVNDKVIIKVKINSTNPVESINIIICTGELCYIPEPMTETYPETKKYRYEWTVPDAIDPDAMTKYRIEVKDSLGNQKISEYQEIDII